ncbi:unnamed protein product, partial [Staurois parvus]
PPHWPTSSQAIPSSVYPFCLCHPSLPIPPLTSIQCPPSLSAIPPLASIQCPPPLSANPSTGLHSVSSTPLCQSLHWPPPLSANPSGLHCLHPFSVPTPLCQCQSL